MRKIVLVLGLALALSGCARFQAAWDIATSASVSPTMVYVASNTFDALEATATNYLRLPKCGTVPCKDPSAVAVIIPAIRSGRVARNNLRGFLKAHPGQLGPQGDYDALNAAIGTLQTIFAQYNVNRS